MAECLTEIQADQLRRHPGRPSPEVSDDWLDGKSWLLVQGKDFQGRPLSFASFLRRFAQRGGRKVSISNPAPDKLLVRFMD